MATKYPIYFDTVKMVINPENITLTKGSNVSEVKTINGFVFQFWPDLPDRLKFHGRVLGDQAYEELKGLQDLFHKENKLISLKYKTSDYKGYFASFSVDGRADHPAMYEYNFEFVFVDPLHLDSKDLALGYSIEDDQFVSSIDVFGRVLRNINQKISSSLPKLT